MATWGRLLPTNDDCTIPGTIICVEVATVATPDVVNPRNSTHRLRCGFAIAGRMERGKWTREKGVYFSDASSWWAWVNSRRMSGKPVWIYSSRASELLTLTEFWSMLEHGKFSLSKKMAVDLTQIKSERLRRKLSRTIPGLLVENDPPTILVAFHKAGWKLICLDLRNFLDSPLNRLAGKLAIPAPRQPCTSAPDPEWREFVEQSARVTQQCVARLVVWHHKLNLGHFAMTVSGMALACFRHKALTHPVYVPPIKADRDFEREGYFNGRCEAFWLGEVRNRRYYAPEGVRYEPGLYDDYPRGPFHLIDARSFYGAVAAFQSVPVSCEAEGDGWPEGEFFPKCLDENFMAHVHLVTPHHEFPCRMPDRTIYARGEFWTTLCGPELKRAVEAGCVKHVGHWRRYNLQPALQSYAWGLWKERVAAEREGNPIVAALVKGMLARLHGKFLQRDYRWQIVPGAVAPKPWHRWQKIIAETGEHKWFRSIGWNVQEERPAGDARHCFPALAAWVTSWGREYLRSWIKIAGGRHALYCSTDSLIVTDEGKCNLERAGIIGDLGIGSCRVVETSDHVEICGANHFRIGGKLCFAGLPVGTLFNSARNPTYRTRSTLRVTLHSASPPIVTETEQVATVKAPSETLRTGPGGWLDHIVLKLEASRWEKTPCES